MTNDVRRPAMGRRIAAGLALAAGLLLSSLPAATAQAATVTIAGDIATCGGDGDAKTAAIVARQPGIVMTAGDNVYSSGTYRQFQRCYMPTWGRFIDRTRPAPGNHDWETPGLAGYFKTFGKRAGPVGRGYYSFTVGSWRIYVLDSTRCLRGKHQRSGCGRGSKQYAWLSRQLAAHPSRCVMAVSHHPRFSTGVGGNHRKTAPLLWLLYRAGAELVINGHDHSYERFALARPDGRADAKHGTRQIVVGTGGAWRTPFRQQVERNSLVRDRAALGVLRLDLRATGYDWRYLRTDGVQGDTGRGACHGRPPA